MVGFKEVKWVPSSWELAKAGTSFVSSKPLNPMHLENTLNTKVPSCYKGEKYILLHTTPKLASKVSLHWLNLWGAITVGNWESKSLLPIQVKGSICALYCSLYMILQGFLGIKMKYYLSPSPLATVSVLRCLECTMHASF